jgi:hypothetical protein
MQLKNYQEDIVLHVLAIVLENQPELKNDIMFVNDVAAYVLNRIQPKYIMSERGFTRLASLHLLNEQNGRGMVPLVELIGLINSGIEIVRGRRKALVEDELFSQPELEVLEVGRIEYYHNFPQIIGRAVDEVTRRPIYNACVTLYIDDDKAEPAEPGWINPYITNIATEGVYSFWPKAIRHSAQLKKSSVTVIIEHEEYKPLRIERSVRTEGAFRVYNFIHGGSIINLETSCLEKI